MGPDPLIAVIDDDASARNAARALIRSMGYRVDAFSGAAEFLRSASLEAASCLVADLRMPGMTGLELHHHLVASGRRIPTIVVTAFPDEVSRGLAGSSGVAAYLAKPMDPERLAEAIRSVLDEPAGRSI